MQKDFPKPPVMEQFDPNLMSEYQMGLLDQAGNRRIGMSKLKQTLFAKRMYNGLYITLKFYADLGLKVTKTHRVLRISQKKAGALHQLEHQNANSVRQQLGSVILLADEQFLLRQNSWKQTKQGQRKSSQDKTSRTWNLWRRFAEINKHLRRKPGSNYESQGTSLLG